MLRYARERDYDDSHNHCAVTGELFEGLPCECANCKRLAADPDVMAFLESDGPKARAAVAKAKGTTP